MKLLHVVLTGGALWAAYKWGCSKGKAQGKAEAMASAAAGEKSPAGKANGT